MKNFTLASLVLVLLVSCAKDLDDYEVLTESQLDTELSTLIEDVSNGEGNGFFILPESGDYAAIPQDPLNPITASKVALGKLLLHETAMGGRPKMDERKFQYACATCHPVASAFGSGRRQGIGEGGMGFGLQGEGRFVDPTMPIDSLDVQPIKVPTLLNLAYQDVALWDGRFGGTGTNAGTEAGWDLIPENYAGFQGVEVQAMQGQNEHRLLINDHFLDSFNYRTLFDLAFSDVPQENRYTRETAGMAIAAYNRTLLSNEAPWQSYLKNDLDALSDQEKRGAIVFLNEGKCVQCHTGPALKDKSFHAFGFADFDNSPNAIVKPAVNMSLVERGRGSFTGNPEDDFKFKTPTLYNLIDIGFFGHGGSFTSIAEVVAYKNEGNPQNTSVPDSQLAADFGGLELTATQMEDLTAFISNGLRDRNLIRYVPDAINSGFCFPANDVPAREDLGCN